MDHLSAPAGSPTERRTELKYSSLGVEVEEPLFLDEAEDHAAAGGNPEPPSPFDLFADEKELGPPAQTILGIASPVVRPAVPPTAAQRSVPQPQRRTLPATSWRSVSRCCGTCCRRPSIHRHRLLRQSPSGSC